MPALLGLAAFCVLVSLNEAHKILAIKDNDSSEHLVRPMLPVLMKTSNEDVIVTNFLDFAIPVNY